MKILISLILIPIFFLKFIVGLIKGMLGVGQLKYIPKLIQQLANEGDTIGTAIKELKFPQVLAWAEANGTVLTSKLHLDPMTVDSFEFSVRLPDDGYTYKVKVTRAPDGSNCAIFRCKRRTDISREDKYSMPVWLANQSAKDHAKGVIREADVIKYSSRNPNLKEDIEDLITISLNAFGAEIALPYLKYSTLCECMHEHWLHCEFFPNNAGMQFSLMINGEEILVNVRTTDPIGQDDFGVAIVAQR